MSFLFISKTLRVNNLKTRIAINAKISVFFICMTVPLRKKWVKRLIFCMQISIKACYKLIEWFWWWWSSIPKVPKIGGLQCLYNISKKKLDMKLIFCMQTNIKVCINWHYCLEVARHFQSTQNMKLVIFVLYIKKKVCHNCFCVLFSSSLSLFFFFTEADLDEITDRLPVW